MLCVIHQISGLMKTRQESESLHGSDLDPGDCSLQAADSILYVQYISSNESLKNHHRILYEYELNELYCHEKTHVCCAKTSVKNILKSI